MSRCWRKSNRWRLWKIGAAGVDNGGKRKNKFQRASFCGVRRLDAALLLQGRKRKLAAMPEWPHSPTHRLDASGAYMVTAGTYQKQPFFRSAKRLTYLRDSLLHFAGRYGWRLEAWSIFPNHYHFIAISPKKAETLARFISHLHSVTAKEINRDDEAPGRKVWFQYWDSRITYQRSYLARLSYVHSNAVRHGLVRGAEEYEWCSAGWFQREAKRPFYETVRRMRSEGVKVEDDFTVSVRDID